MRYCIDTEFATGTRESGSSRSPLRLISVGVCAQDGRRYYAQNTDIDLHDVPEWVAAHVVPNLLACPTGRAFYDHNGRCSSKCPWRYADQIRSELIDFLDPERFGDGSPPEFWGDYCAFDYVVLSQLYGEMDDWPDGWPMYFNDLRQFARELGVPGTTLDNEMLRRNARDAATPTEIPEFFRPHNALADAYAVMDGYDYLAQIAEDRERDRLHSLIAPFDMFRVPASALAPRSASQSFFSVATSAPPEVDTDQHENLQTPSN